jgi:hypothetical protein
MQKGDTYKYLGFQWSRLITPSQKKNKNL